MRASTGSVIRRRIALLGAVAAVLVAGLPVAEPQQPTKAFRIMELNPGAPQEQQKVFRQALRDLGYVQGQNILIEDRFAAGNDDRLHDYAAEAVRMKVDVIVAISSAAIRAATNAAKAIPIVGLDLESDPVASGFIASLARPGGNLTGVFVDLPELTGKGLELLKEAIPGVARVAVLRDPTLNPALLPAAEAAARSLGLRLQIVEARAPNEYDGAFKWRSRATTMPSWSSRLLGSTNSFSPSSGQGIGCRRRASSPTMRTPVS